MNASMSQQFYFHADASAVGGYLKLPVEKAIASRASASLAQAGGEDSITVRKVEGHGVFTVKKAYVRVHGRHEPEHGLWRSVVTATVEKLNIQEIITADRIVAQLSVLHWPDGRPDRVSISGTHYLNLRMGNKLVEPVIVNRTFQLKDTGVEPNETDFEALPTFHSLYDVSIEQHRAATNSDNNWPEWLKHRIGGKDPKTTLEERGSALCSIVQSAKVSSPLVSYAHVVRVPDFGNVFLGELLISQKHTHLTMLRTELGSLAQGNLSFASAHSNGSFMP